MTLATPSLVLAAALGLAVLAGCTHIDPKRAHDVELTKAERMSLEHSVAREFADPAHVQFRNLRARDNFYPDGTVIRSVCGEVWGKTVLGTPDGFIGFTRNLENGKWVTPAVGQPCY